MCNAEDKHGGAIAPPPPSTPLIRIKSEFLTQNLTDFCLQ